MTDIEITPELRAQVANQCRVVEHLAKRIAKVHGDYVRFIQDGCLGNIISTIGPDTADIMDVLGDILSNMGAIVQEDGWCTPIFKESQRLFPVATCGKWRLYSVEECG